MVSIIVPTINEAKNLRTLLARIDKAMIDKDYEVIIVDDDSHDDTALICDELKKLYPLTLHTRLIPSAGLSGAVLFGFEQAKGNIFVVMDADLQHPPEAIPSLIAAIKSGKTDFVIGSRYVDGGKLSGKWGLARRLNSYFARLLAVPLVGKLHDPMSGFFALTRDTWAKAEYLDPLGYKIGMELIYKCRVDPVLEVPIDFAARFRGQSKMTVKQQFNYLRHLGRLYRYAIYNKQARHTSMD